MSFSAVITERVVIGGETITKNNTLSSGGKASLDESFATGGTDVAASFALDVSACKSFYMVSDYAITVETNSGSSADDTITLAAGIPYVWYTGKYDSFLLGTDVTALYITNASGSTARLQIEALYDPTP